ncbi:ALF repeat-containing protein, partial [Amycolatopsis magusensis]|nr:ALF repeat-containing protein [Amycolatopsis magusensis]
MARPRRLPRRVLALPLAAMTALSLLVAPAQATSAQPPSAQSALTDRAVAFSILKAGGPGVARAAETALAGTDEDVRVFLATGFGVAEEHDLRARVGQMLAEGGPGVRRAAQTALGGSAETLRTFIASGWQRPWEDDMRVQIAQL